MASSAPMSEAHLRFTCRIAAPPEAVFNLVADLPRYGRWLPDSSRHRWNGRRDAVSRPPRNDLPRRRANPEAGQGHRVRPAAAHRVPAHGHNPQPESRPTSRHASATPSSPTSARCSASSTSSSTCAVRSSSSARPPLGLPEGERHNMACLKPFAEKVVAQLADRVDGSAGAFPPAGRSPAPSCI